jgi:xanthine dehydrogenase YagR molybdenum-binding subunit
MNQVAADALQLPLSRVRFELGDSQFPQAPVSGGSQTAASVGPAVQAAAAALREKIILAAVADKNSPLYKLPIDSIVYRDGWLHANEKSESLIDLAARRKTDEIWAEASAAPGEEKKNYSMHAFGGVFVEARVDEKLGIVQLPRIVGAYAVGNLLNASTGRSQLLGGIVWGIGMALHEQSLLDPRAGRFVNNNLAEYHVPVNADIRDIEILFVKEEDKIVNSLGAKGIGELGITGTAAAISNAVFHATGKRQRDLPITPDKLLV